MKTKGNPMTEEAEKPCTVCRKNPRAAGGHLSRCEGCIAAACSYAREFRPRGRPARPRETAREKKRRRQQVFVLTLPPSVNGLWLNVPGRGRAPTPAYAAWKKTAGWELVTQKPRPIEGHVAVKVRAGLVTKKRDIDNVAKPLLDLLTEHRVIEDDALVADLSLSWDRTIEAGKVEARVWRTVPPQSRKDAKTRARVGAATRARWNRLHAAARGASAAA